MRKPALLPIFIMTAITLTATAQENGPDDSFLWLEEVDGKRALEWVESHNRATGDVLQQHPDFTAIKEQCLEIFNSKDRIAYPAIRGDFVYNFWQDDTFERGLWRRAPLEDYLKGSPDWETVLDIDALCKKEGEKWSFKGSSVLSPSFDICMLRLSRGGGDAVVLREFDLLKKTFVEDGFRIEESKGRTSWLDRDTLLVSTDFGEGSMTDSGYPRIVKLWKRGTPLNEAIPIFEGEQEDVSVGAFVRHTPERLYALITRGIAFYKRTYFALEDGQPIKLNLPEDLNIEGFLKGQMLAELKSDWVVDGQTYKQGSIVSLDYELLLQGTQKVAVLYEPRNRSSISTISTTANQVLVTVFIGGQYDELTTYSRDQNTWVGQKVARLKNGTLSLISTDRFSDRYFISYESLLTPRSLYYVPGANAEMTKVQSLPAYFNSDDFKVVHYESTSKDGTKIPYTVILSKTARKDGSNPTLLYGYGGFEVSLRPGYSSMIGSSWLSRGGVYVVAHIRGGGEFGPEWHRAALKENRQRSYDDFISVSEDLIKRGIASPETLGIMGGSNGGLLVGAVAMQRPDLYRAVVCAVPLLDMKRFNKLLAGASWMAEYGNPDLPEEWAYIKKYSPYHNVREAQDYPKIFFKTSTRDDRVHPGHARKMAAKMERQGHDVFYFENTEGGHGAGVTNEQRAFMESLTYAYLLKMLKP